MQNRIINTALCSFGMSGWVFHAPFIDVDPRFCLYGVWERSKNLAQEKYAGIKTFRTLEEMLADEKLELVIVNTPNYTHFDFAKKALLANKHVVLEKPFTITVAEGQELIALAAKQNKIISVYQNRRYDSDYKIVKEVLKKGWLGNIIETEIHYDRYKEALSPKLHKETPGPGTGCLYDLGSHLIDQALQLFGMPGAIFADIAIMRPISKVDDYFELLLYYPSHRVRLKSNYQVREPLPGYILHGSKGSFIKHKTDTQETLLQSGCVPGSEDWGKEPDNEKGLLHTEKDGTIVKEFLSSPNGNYGEYYHGIYKAIAEGQPVPVSAEEGLDVIKIIEAAFKSNHQGKVVDII